MNENEKALKRQMDENEAVLRREIDEKERALKSQLNKEKRFMYVSIAFAIMFNNSVSRRDEETNG